MFANHKAVGVGQVFIYIVAALTFGLILIFGYRAVQDFLNKGEQVAFVQFKNDLESSIKKIYTEYGSVRIKEFHLPARYMQICFVDMEKEYDAALCQSDPTACTVWEEASSFPPDQRYEAVDQNVFLTPAAPVTLKVYRISIADDKNYLCQDLVQGKFTLQLEGRGDRTLLAAG